MIMIIKRLIPFLVLVAANCHSAIGIGLGQGRVLKQKSSKGSKSPKAKKSPKDEPSLLPTWGPSVLPSAPSIGANGAHLQVVKALIDAYPGSCSMKDYNGHTALTYVDNSDHEDTVKDQFTALFEDYEDRISGKDTMQEDAMCKEEDLDNQTTKDSSEAWC
jgi:hypothetical protein